MLMISIMVAISYSLEFSNKLVENLKVICNERGFFAAPPSPEN